MCPGHGLDGIWDYVLIGLGLRLELTAKIEYESEMSVLLMTSVEIVEVIFALHGIGGYSMAPPRSFDYGVTDS